MSEQPLVLFSRRLGELGPIEEDLARRTGAALEVVSLATEDELIAAGGRADVLVVGAVEPVSARVLGALARTRLIVRRGVGVDNVDVAAAEELGIPVAYVPDGSVEEVSDHAVALLLGLERRIAAADRAVRDGAGPGTMVDGARRFADLTVGVIGFGRIGRAAAHKVRPLVGAVLVSDPVVDPEELVGSGFVPVGLDELFARSDAITLHVPLSDATRGLVDARRLALARPGLTLVNTARGELVDEEALLAALREGRIGGAALDVTAVEPLPADSPLRDEPALLLTGHTAAKGRESGRTLRTAVATAIERWLGGEDPPFLARTEPPAART
jgi:D-3-phosphoglycerate dehydrogenase